MKILLLAFLLSSAAAAQNLTFSIVAADGTTSPLPSTYPFPATSVGQTTTITVTVQNTSGSTLTLNGIYVDVAAGPSAQSNSFSVIGFEQSGATLAPLASKQFSITFSPAGAGDATGHLQVNIQGQGFAPVSTLSGTGVSSSVSLTCTDSLLTSLCNGTTSIPANSSITFGGTNSTTGVALGKTYSIPFTLTNNTSAAIPTPTISNELYALQSFTSPDLANLPTSIAAGSTVNFTIVFTPQATAPGPSTAQGATLTVGTATYTLQGYELITANNDPIQVTCVYSTGKPCQAPMNTSNTFSVGPDPSTLSLAFTVTNPNPVGTSFADITLPALPSLSDTTDFTMGTATLIPTGSSSAGNAVTAGQSVTIQPGYSLAFQVTFTGSVANTAILTIGGGLSYTLMAQPTPVVGSPQSGLAGLTLMCGSTPCSSQTFASAQQVPVSVQVPSASTTLPFVSLSIAFTSAVAGVTNDPAIEFVELSATSTGQIPFTPNSAAGTSSTAQFTLATGTTAGTIAITVAEPGVSSQPYTVSIPILPSKVQITSSTAAQNSPNLTVTIFGYDNTYSANDLSFTFYDVNGTNLTPNAIQVNAASAFKQYFFGPQDEAGMFKMQVTFPITGDVTQVGSVTANITNSAGQSSVTQSFQ